MKSDPVIFIHTGRHRHLEIAIERLRLSNKDVDIILIGDERNKGIADVEHHLVSDYFESAEKFEKDNYVHMSKNTYQFELFCYQRWFVLQEFAERNKVDFLWYMDSDFLIYENLDNYLKNLVGDNHVDVVGFDSSSSGSGDSFMPCFNRFSLRAIQEITAFFVKSYEDKEIFSILKSKWKKHHVEKLAGGICDMTQLKLFFDSNPSGLSIVDAYDSALDLVPDGNINSSLNYFHNDEKFKTFLGLKHVRVEDFKAYGKMENGEEVQFVGSHFQGRAKRKMHYYSRRNYSPNNFLNIMTSSYQSFEKKSRYYLIKRAKKLLS